MVLVEQLGMCLKELRTMKNANTVNGTRLMLNKLLTDQERERKEIEEQMAEEACHFNEFTASYQRLVDDAKESEVITKNAEQVMTNAQAAIAKAQALIQVNEQKLVAAKKKLEDLEVA